ncbi:uncharacterized protein LOC142590125 [Dermacentor variabilis]|uniref:uncharacterized protein LOC142590125 n=1 Tax=Dermacentor variabilis TaxID=34621 RepID=UPI003F5C5556
MPQCERSRTRKGQGPSRAFFSEATVAIIIICCSTFPRVVGTHSLHERRRHVRAAKPRMHGPVDFPSVPSPPAVLEEPGLTMATTTRGVVVLALLLGRALMTSTEAPGATRCGESRKITFSSTRPGVPVSHRVTPSSTVLLNVFVWLHRGFSASLSSTELPKALRHADVLDFTLLTKLALSSTGSVVLLVTSLFLALAVPVVGLIALKGAREAVYSQPETEQQAASRVKTSLGLWILIASLAFMVIGALSTVQHVSATRDAAMKQGAFLVNTMPGVSRKLLNDWGIISGLNVEELLKALDQRLRGKHVL